MKKILIVNNNMHIGGVQKALVNLLWSLRGHYDITLLLFHNAGEYLKDIPQEVHIITPNSGYRYLGMAKNDTHSLKDKLGRSFYAAVSRLLGRKYAVAWMDLGQKKLEGYDAAISYLHNGGDNVFYGGCNEFVLKHVSARKKVTFLHCDYMLCGANTQANAKQYAKFDVIVACSQGCADAFVKCNPALKERVDVINNCHRLAQVRQDAEAASVDLPRDKINIVTVARLGKEKSVERAVEAIAGLGSLKEKLHYYIIGDGIQKPLLQRIIAEEKLEGVVTLCGMKDNPYGYIKAADLLLISSLSEAAPMVIGEAACLGTPILSTETSSAREMIENTGFGWVCENSVAGMRESLGELLAEPDKVVQKRAFLRDITLTNDETISRILNII